MDNNNVSSILDFDSISIFEKKFKGIEFKEGTFKIKILNVKQEVQVNALIRSECRRLGIPLPEFDDKGNLIEKNIDIQIDDTLNYTFIVSLFTLDSAIIEHPDDFPGMQETRDTELIGELWTWYNDCQIKYIESIKKKRKRLKLY